MRIISIEGVSIIVSESDYQYYWSTYNCGEDSDAFKVACRRILGLGPNDHNLDIRILEQKLWACDLKDSPQQIQKILKSGIVEYNERFFLDNTSLKINADYITQKEQQINPNDPEFEPELYL